MGIFDRVRSVTQEVSLRLDTAKTRREIEKHEQALRANPQDVFALQELSVLYQEAPEIEKAVESLCQLAEIYKDRNSLELAFSAYRKAERLATGEQRIDVLRNFVALHVRSKRFDDLYPYAKQVVDILLDRQDVTGAQVFLDDIPTFGPKEKQCRNELSALIVLKRQTGPLQMRATWTGKHRAAPPASAEETFPDRVVLVVDDDPYVLQMFEVMFRPLGCRVLTAPNGEEGYVRAVEHHPSLIIADLMMPLMDGSRLFAELREHPILKNVPFVCMSSLGNPDERAAALEQGVEEYWVKPLHPQEVLVRTRRLLKRRSVVSSSSDLSGKLGTVGLWELINILERQRRTGILAIRSETDSQTALLYLADGQIIDAELGNLAGKAVVFRLMYWLNGDFEFHLASIMRAKTIDVMTHDLLIEALRRYDLSQKVLAALPPPGARYYCSDELHDLSAISEEREFRANLEKVAALFDGRRTVGECVAILTGDLETLALVQSLMEQNLLLPGA